MISGFGLIITFILTYLIDRGSLPNNLWSKSLLVIQVIATFWVYVSIDMTPQDRVVVADFFGRVQRFVLDWPRGTWLSFMGLLLLIAGVVVVNIFDRKPYPGVVNGLAVYVSIGMYIVGLVLFFIGMSL